LNKTDFKTNPHTKSPRLGMENIHFSRGRRQDGLAIVWDEHAETRHLKHLKQPTGHGIHGYPWLSMAAMSEAEA